MPQPSRADTLRALAEEAVLHVAEVKGLVHGLVDVMVMVFWRHHMETTVYRIEVERLRARADDLAQRLADAARRDAAWERLADAAASRAVVAEARVDAARAALLPLRALAARGSAAGREAVEGVARALGVE